jgi:hypothetical protein
MSKSSWKILCFSLRLVFKKKETVTFSGNANFGLKVRGWCQLPVAGIQSMQECYRDPTSWLTAVSVRHTETDGMKLTSKKQCQSIL